MQSSQQMLSDNIQHLGHLDMIATELAGAQEKDSFSTNLFLIQNQLDPCQFKNTSILIK